MPNRVVVNASTGETSVEDTPTRTPSGPSVVAEAAQQRRDRRRRMREDVKSASSVDDLKAVVADLLDELGGAGG